MGRYERSFSSLHAGVSPYLRADGTFGLVDGRPPDVDGVFFGFMEATGRNFFAVRAQYGEFDIYVKTPVLLDRPRHTDGKGFVPQISRFGDKYAQQLLADLITKNPQQATDLRRIAAELGWQISSPSAMKPKRARPVRDKVALLPEWYQWRDRVQAWAKKRKYGQHDADALVAYFERAFSNTRCFERAWFGTHPSTISLVVGGIFLASLYHRSGEDHGLWLLLDVDAVPLEGIDYKPVKATQESVHPLRWAHSKSIAPLGAIIESDALWESFSRASEKILASPIAADRDAVQQRRGKIRLVDFWPEDGDDELLVTSGGDGQILPTTRALEGKVYFRYSRHRHRERKLREAKIEEARKRSPDQRLRCEVPGCGFDFEERYGEIGRGFVHVHHIDQLSDLESPQEVTLADLVIVCANCHAMIHRGGNNRSLAGLLSVNSKIRD